MSREKVAIGSVEVEVFDIKTGEVLSSQIRSNTITQDGEDFLTAFMSSMFSNKYDASGNPGESQLGYFDFISIGVGFRTALLGSTTVLVLPYKPVGVGDSDVSAFDGTTVKIHTGIATGETSVVATNGYNPANASFGDNPTLTVATPFTQPIASDVQFTTGPSPFEKGLQGEATVDGGGVSFTDPAESRVLVSAKTIQVNQNEYIVEAEFGPIALSGGTTIKIVEAGLHNTITNGQGGTQSGNITK